MDIFSISIMEKDLEIQNSGTISETIFSRKPEISKTLFRNYWTFWNSRMVLKFQDCSWNFRIVPEYHFRKFLEKSFSLI